MKSLGFLFLVACSASQPSDGDAAPQQDANVPDTTMEAEVGGDAGPDDRFVTKVVSYEPGECAGFGQAAMPAVVMGAPVGFGTSQGSTHVVSLGKGGSIVLSFPPNAIVDGPGVDFVVFENAFYVSGNPNNVFAEPGEVSVSDDGTTWKTYPCTATSAPYGSCAGWHPVLSDPTNGISPFDYPACGGDGFDLADVGMTHVQFVRIKDMGSGTCEDGGPKTNNVGFDLDAIAILHGVL